MPSLVSANEKASLRLSRLGRRWMRSRSTRLGRRAWITAKNAIPVRQLGPKSFTSMPRCLHSETVSGRPETVGRVGTSTAV